MTKPRPTLTLVNIASIKPRGKYTRNFNDAIVFAGVFDLMRYDVTTKAKVRRGLLHEGLRFGNIQKIKTIFFMEN